MRPGAEAILERVGNTVTKTRIPKPWRHPDIDYELRLSRTKREAKVLEKAPVPRPQLLSVDEKSMCIEMEYLPGELLKDLLNPGNQEQLGVELGKTISTLHDAGIIHGDLTTSNMILSHEKVHLIDFGLSFFSEHVEDKATDMHLLKQVLQASHPSLDVWNSVLQGYAPDAAFLERLAQVEGRGRYKHKRPND